MHKHALLLGLGLAFSCATAAWSESADFPSVGESAVVLVSQASISVAYSIRPRDGQWAQYTITSGTNSKISCSNCTTSGFDIEINTEGRIVSYNLDSGKRFVIKWNDEKRVWDVFEIANQ